MASSPGDTRQGDKKPAYRIDGDNFYVEKKPKSSFVPISLTNN